MSASEDSSRANTPDLCILSNDIPTSPVDEAAFPTEDEEEPGTANGNHPPTPPLNLKINLTQTLTLSLELRKGGWGIYQQPGMTSVLVLFIRVCLFLASSTGLRTILMVLKAENFTGPE